MRVDHREQEQVAEVLEAWWASNMTLVGHVHSPGQGRLGGMWSARVAPFCLRCMSFIRGGILWRHRYVPDLGELGPEDRSSKGQLGSWQGSDASGSAAGHCRCRAPYRRSARSW